MIKFLLVLINKRRHIISKEIIDICNDQFLLTLQRRVCFFYKDV